MKTNIKRLIKHSLLVEGDELGSLVEFISSKYEKVRLSAECIDNSELEADDIAEIINFDNPTYRKIINITINANTSYDETLRLSIDSTSGLNMFMNAARLNITSKSDETAVYLSQEISKRLREMKPEYDFLARFPITLSVSLLFTIWIVAQGVGKMLGLIKLETPPPSNSSLSWNDIFTFVLLGLLVVVAANLLLDRLQSILFPRVFFLIGKQKRAMENLKKWRMVVLTAIILSVVSSLIASFIFQGLQSK